MRGIYVLINTYTIFGNVIFNFIKDLRLVFFKFSRKYLKICLLRQNNIFLNLKVQPGFVEWLRLLSSSNCVSSFLGSNPVWCFLTHHCWKGLIKCSKYALHVIGWLYYLRKVTFPRPICQDSFVTKIFLLPFLSIAIDRHSKI